MDFKECLEYIDSTISDGDRAYFIKTKRNDTISLHHSFGRWIRNNCGLWEENGLVDIQKDIKRIRNNDVRIDACEYLEEEGKKSKNIGTDYSLDHPDNVSSVIIEVYHDILNDRFDFDETKYNHVLYIMPYKDGIYFGNEIESWLSENINKEEYEIIKHPISIVLNTFSRPHRFVFMDDSGASAFKLRWM